VINCALFRFEISTAESKVFATRDHQRKRNLQAKDLKFLSSLVSLVSGFSCAIILCRQLKIELCACWGLGSSTRNPVLGILDWLTHRFGGLHRSVLDSEYIRSGALLCLGTRMECALMPLCYFFSDFLPMSAPACCQCERMAADGHGFIIWACRFEDFSSVAERRRMYV